MKGPVVKWKVRNVNLLYPGIVIAAATAALLGAPISPPQTHSVVSGTISTTEISALPWHHIYATRPTVKAKTPVHKVDRVPREVYRASRSRYIPPLPHPKPYVQPPVVISYSGWRSTMSWQEVWIDTRESGLNPMAENPSGARGLGQLLDSTYASLGMVPDWNPYHELQAQRKYIAERYGTEDNAVAFWRAHSWY